ncbi:MAG TPA: transaldolase family protein, partial [Ktedonobacterales bacterium]|nr:transaldolase family protein [Ktedonobacterales bacterium]
MDIYLDTAQLDEVRAAKRWGVLRGITTNPSHVAKAGVRDLKAHLQEMCWSADVPISVEVVTVDSGEMVAQGQEYAAWSPHVVVKIPTISAGLEAMAQLTSEPVTATCEGCAHVENCPIRERFAMEGQLQRRPEVNATLIFTANQAILALAAGANYVSPFVGRLDAIGEDGMQLVADIADILRAQQQPGKIIAAALRHPMHVTQVAKLGAHIATMSY